MGMVLGLVSVDDDTISKVLADPPQIWKVIAPDDWQSYEARGDRTMESWLSRFLGRRKRPASFEPNLGPPVEDIDLDKSWHGIHYLLTHTMAEGDPPLNFLIVGGTEVGDIDVGYGTARAFYSTSVREINDALKGINAEYLSKRYNAVEMKRLDIYPDIWDDEETGIEYCTEYFDALKSFVSRSAARDLGMFVYLS